VLFVAKKVDLRIIACQRSELCRAH
jgi:hypothetical protein